MNASDRLAAHIPDGASLLLAPDYSGCAMAVIAGLVRREAKDLRLIGAPQLGLQAEFLIAAGAVQSVETAAISLGEFGQAPAFERARQQGRIKVIESTCPAIHAGLQASERAVPFAPLRGVIGSDLVKIRDDWAVIKNPMPPHDPILTVPAICPDFAMFHAPLGDEAGNVWIGVRREMMLMAHAAKASLVSVDRRQSQSLLADPAMAPGTIPALYLDRVDEIDGGAKPLACAGRYPADPGFVAAYKRSFKLGDGLNFIHSWANHGDFSHA